MTAAELITALQEFPPTAPVSLSLMQPMDATHLRQTVVALIVDQTKDGNIPAGTALLTAPLDLEGLPSERRKPTFLRGGFPPGSPPLS